MNHRTQKFMSLLLALMLIFSLLLYPTAYAAEVGGVQAKMNQILNDYPNGSYFTVNGSACAHGVRSTCTNCSLLQISKTKGKSVPSGQGNAWTCVAFASYVMNQVFGTKLSGNIEQVGSGKKNANQASTYKDARIGDLIYFYNSKGKFTHVAVCMGTTSDAIILYECNATGKTAEVSYRTIPYSQVSAHRSGVYTSVYRAKNYDKINGAVTSLVTITFDPNGGHVDQTSKTVMAGGIVGRMPTPTREGYIFLGWGTAKNTSGFLLKTGEEIIVEKNTTLYAMWKKTTETYAVTLDDGSVCSLITVTNGSTYGSLPTPSRDGYIFEGWYTQISGGSQITSSTKVNLAGDQTLYAHWSKIKDGGHWGTWSEWSTMPVYASDTRQVETRTVTEQVKVSDGYTEYRYVGYVTDDGKHDCWCETYLRSRFGSANLQYSAWSTTRYNPNQSRAWTCGRCGGSHIGAVRVDADGRSWWYEYILPDDGYWWEESRTVDAQYETREVTQYRYRDWIHD